MSRIQPPAKDPSRPVPAVRPVAATRPIAAEPISWTDPSQLTPILILAGLVLLLLLAYFDMFALTSAAWSEGLYSHGWLVPLFALGLLWMRWEPFEAVPAAERWIGVGLLAAGLILRLVAAEYGKAPYDRLSFIPAIFGVFMMVGGLHVVRWAWPALGFLLFMFPLPSKLEQTVLLWLQRLATIASTFVLQTMGVSAYRQGNLIHMPGLEQPLTVADACSGLRMATIFVALAVAMVFIVERPWWDKLVILISAIPIALLVNIIRITLTGLLYMWVGEGSELATHLGHDWAGYFMMPLALIFLWLELQILERLTVPVDTVQLRPVGGARGVAPVPLR
jgi:exosortase